MGLLKALGGAASTVMADQWRDYFYCDSLPVDVIVKKGTKREGKKSSNRGNNNIITDGSIIAIADGQCMIIVDNGEVADICAEPGEYTYDMSTEPSLFYGNLSDTIPAVFKNIGKRFTFGGEAPKEQRVYYFNTKELVGNKYGTANPVPFRVTEREIGLSATVRIKCFGEYSYKVTNPILFYTNVCANVSDTYERSQIDSQLRTELLNALQPAFAKIGATGVHYDELPGYTMEISDALSELLSKKWSEQRGIEIVSFGIASITANEEDEKKLQELQFNAALRDPNMAAAHLAGATASSMQTAAANENGAMMAFAGMNMAGNMGGNMAANLFAMGQQNGQAAPAQAPAPAAAPANAWTCSCGAVATGNFCPECGAKKPAADGWTCSCGAVNKGKFCSNCGTKKPAGVPQYKCDKCGWEPEDPTNPPKFCPECGDPFGDEDQV